MDSYEWFHLHRPKNSKPYCTYVRSTCVKERTDSARISQTSRDGKPSSVYFRPYSNLLRSSFRPITNGSFGRFRAQTIDIGLPAHSSSGVQCDSFRNATLTWSALFSHCQVPEDHFTRLQRLNKTLSVSAREGFFLDHCAILSTVLQLPFRLFCDRLEAGFFEVVEAVKRRISIEQSRSTVWFLASAPSHVSRFLA